MPLKHKFPFDETARKITFLFSFRYSVSQVNEQLANECMNYFIHVNGSELPVNIASSSAINNSDSDEEG